MNARSLVALPSYAEEVLSGLTARHKHLPCKLFYDDRGSALFEKITHLREYYPTRTELEILEERSREIAISAGSPVSIVELGAGTATKTGVLLNAFARRQMRLRYFPVDISLAALQDAKKRIVEECPGVLVKPIAADFAHGFGFLKSIPSRKVVLYLGSSIGNFNWNDAVAMLGKVREQLVAGDAFLLGTDMVKGEGILVPAYDDAQGVTEQFNKNILMRLNREVGANFDLAAFRHVAEWNPKASRMEIYLESVRAQSVQLGVLGGTIGFIAGERIHTENSYKYTMEMVQRLLCFAGFKLEKSWFDSRNWFGLHLARV